MTSVVYEPFEYHIRIEGHAGAAPKGEDLVCAGVSALSFALLLAVERDGYSYRPETRVEQGKALIDVRCDPRGICHAECGAVLDAFAGGFELMARKYPEFMSFERREREGK